MVVWLVGDESVLKWVEAQMGWEIELGTFNK